MVAVVKSSRLRYPCLEFGCGAKLSERRVGALGSRFESRLYGESYGARKNGYEKGMAWESRVEKEVTEKRFLVLIFCRLLAEKESVISQLNRLVETKDRKLGELKRKTCKELEECKEAIVVKDSRILELEAWSEEQSRLHDLLIASSEEAMMKVRNLNFSLELERKKFQDFLKDMGAGEQVGEEKFFDVKSESKDESKENSIAAFMDTKTETDFEVSECDCVDCRENMSPNSYEETESMEEEHFHSLYPTTLSMIQPQKSDMQCNDCVFNLPISLDNLSELEMDSDNSELYNPVPLKKNHPCSSSHGLSTAIIRSRRERIFSYICGDDTSFWEYIYGINNMDVINNDSSPFPFPKPFEFD